MNEDTTLAACQELASSVAGLPYLQKALEKLRGKLRAHVAVMHAWGVKHGQPKETLAGLAESAR
jgi:hypothetical protein